MKNRIVLLLVGSAIALTGCPDENKGIAVTADLTGAVGVAIQKAAPAQPSSAQTGGAVATLVKVAADGTVTSVLSDEFPSHQVIVSASHVLVTGVFDNILPVGSTDPIDCYLLAIPVAAAGDPVLCVSQNPVTTVDNGGVVNWRGMRIRDGSLYFVVQHLASEQFGQLSGPTQYRRWDQVSASTELLIEIQIDAQTEYRLVEIYAGFGTPNQCVLISGEQGGSDGLLCGDPNAGTFQAVSIDAISARNLQVGNLVMTVNEQMSLADFTPVARPNDNIPLPEPHRFVFLDTLRAFGISNVTNELVLADANGTELVDNTVQWEYVIGGQTYGYVYGQSTLQRFDLATGTLEATNYLGDTQLLQVTDVSVSTDDRIRIDGTAANGLPAVVSIDTTTGAIDVASADIPRLESIVPLQ